MMVVTLSETRVTARKHHQCFMCYRAIAPGTSHTKQTNKYEYIYSIRWHDECQRLWAQYIKDAGMSPRDFDDEGFLPLYDDWIEIGEFDRLCNDYRGYHPEAITRLELTKQLAEARWLEAA